MPKRAFLALFRAGPQSLHPHAVAKLDEQNFDYALSYFGDDEPPSEGAVFVHRQKGAKWPGLLKTLLAHRDQICEYEYVWLPDDDLLCTPETVSRMFLICSDLRLDLAQPALTPDSYFTHPITVQHAQFQVRFTNFVEIMAPVFSRDMLSKATPSLTNNISGYGLDALWPRLTQLGRVAIIDETTVRHTRPLGGPNYSFSKNAGISPIAEDWLVAATHFIESLADTHINFAGLLQSGDPICLGSTARENDAMLRELLASINGLNTSARQLTSYLRNHLDYIEGGPHGARYPRSLLRVVLNQTLKNSGIQFPCPSSQDRPVALATVEGALP